MAEEDDGKEEETQPNRKQEPAEDYEHFLMKFLKKTKLLH